MPNESRHIVIEGPIGVGKTSLAKKLAHTFCSDTLLEKSEVNPFLKRFYKDPKSVALSTQLFFLFQRAKQFQYLHENESDGQSLISDFILDKDRLFARLNLDDDEYWLYEQVYQQLSLNSPTPDLVVYLQAPADVLRKRVHKRGVPFEKIIRKEYLERLNNAYKIFFHAYDRSPLLVVNTKNINPIDNEHDYEILLEKIRFIKHGKHYFNPTSDK